MSGESIGGAAGGARRMKHIILLMAVALVSAAAGYGLGFRQAWGRSLMADATVRSNIAIGNLRAIEVGRLDDVKISLEAEVDSGLMWWAQLEQFPWSALNLLSGQSVHPDFLRYVERAATYRKTHASPLSDPELIKEMLDSVRTANPEFADELVESGKQKDAAIALMIQKYAK